MLSIQEPKSTSKVSIPLFRQAFRPFFLLGTAFLIIALVLWLSFLAAFPLGTPFGGMLFWHKHELLFGFVNAIIVGFFMTAIQNWTGMRAINGSALMLLVVVWLLARALFWLNPLGNSWLTSTIDLLFLPLCAINIGLHLYRARNWRNMLFLPILTLLWCANALTHLGTHWQRPELIESGIYGAIFLIVTLITIIAGRVVPMFTANGSGTQRLAPWPWLDKFLIGLSGLWVALFISTGIQHLAPEAIAALMGVTGLLHLIRALRWRPQVIWRNPLLWSLHLSYWFIPLGFALLGLHFLGMNIRLSTGIHAITVGGMGCLILAMMARISLGHSGRPLVISKLMVVGLALVLIAGLCRLLANYLPQNLILSGLLLSGGLLIMAYGFYLKSYLLILISARLDGRDG